MSDFLGAPSPPRRPPARRGSDASGFSSASAKSLNNPASSATETVDRRVQRRIDVCGRLGRGAYGIVWKGIERRGKRRVVALKKCFNAFASSSDAQRIYREVSYLLKLRGHVNVVQLRHVIRAKHDLDVYLVFEYMETDLHAVIRADLLEDVHKKYIAYQLLKALKYIHSAGVVHRDIKPGNVLVDARGHVALTDFGLCALGVHEDGAPLRSFCGTVTYMAPELLVGHAYGTSVDWWALGALVFEIAAGRPPFEDHNRRRMFYAILHLPPPFPLDFSNELIDLLAGLLEKRPDRRLGVRRPEAEAEAKTVTPQQQPPLVTPRRRLLFSQLLTRTKGDADTADLDAPPTPQADEAPPPPPPPESWDEDEPPPNMEPMAACAMEEPAPKAAPWAIVCPRPAIMPPPCCCGWPSAKPCCCCACTAPPAPGGGKSAGQGSPMAVVSSVSMFHQ
mmetsp:Transcript_8408/g.25263  ORF Transcript_8408/g.25263 Transcript_8408/m.25263 type:complete len:449 (-) Transcript_8408:226-1572(-)